LDFGYKSPIRKNSHQHALPGSHRIFLKNDTRAAIAKMAMVRLKRIAGGLCRSLFLGETFLTETTIYNRYRILHPLCHAICPYLKEQV